MADIVRPNGKPYRPRKPPAYIPYANEWCAYDGIIVFRTHDRAEAYRVARTALESLADDHDMEPIKPSDGRLDWLRDVPWDDSGAGYDRSWVTDRVRGVPCVVFEGTCG